MTVPTTTPPHAFLHIQTPAGWMPRLWVVLWLVAAWLGAAGAARAQAPGSVDMSFNPGTSGINNSVSSVAVQSNGKVVIGGAFSGVDRNYVARLNADGTLDATFNSGTGANGPVYSVAVQSDGKMVIGGGFTSFNGVARSRVARLNADGTLDATFNSGTGANGPVYSVAVQGDGKVVIGGYFTSVNGVARRCIVRLNADGSVDTTFDPGTGAISTVYSVVVQGDGKVVIGGEFDSVNGVARKYIARLNADGSVDTTFDPGTGADNGVNSVAVQGDGKVVIGGTFTSFNGVARNRVARLNADGTLDTTFNPGTGANNPVLSVAAHGNGKVVIGGQFTSIDGVASNYIARLNANGSLDAAFNPGTGMKSSVSSVTVQDDGKVIIGSALISINGVERYWIARLNVDGSLDATFNSRTGANTSVSSATVQNDGKVIIGGFFTSFNGVARNRIARLNKNGSLDASFNPGAGANDYVRSAAVQSDGKVVIGGQFTNYDGVGRNRIARLNADGTLDTTFAPGTGANGEVRSVMVQNDGKVFIGGNFSSYNGVNRSRLARLHTDGSLDTAFNVGNLQTDEYVNSAVVQSDGRVVVGGKFTFGAPVDRNIVRLSASGVGDSNFNLATRANGEVYSVAVQSDGKTILGGFFTNINGAVRNRVARLNADGNLDTTFNPGAGPNALVRSVAVQGDGKVVIGGYFTSFNGVARNNIARLNADGSLDTTFDPGAGADNSIGSVVVQSDGKLIIGGEFTSINGVGFAYVARLFGGELLVPGVAGGGADGLQANSAAVRASINAQGAATTVVFQYGLTTGYGGTTPAQNIGAGTSPVEVSATLGGLTPSTLYHYRVVATNAVGTSNGADGTFTTLSVGQDWRRQNFGSTDDSGLAADLADPDGDGVVNLVERALGLEPWQAGTAGLPVVERDPVTGRLTLSAAKGAYAADVVFSAEASADLRNWTTAGVTVLANTATTFQARDDGAAAGGGGQRFLRLRVTAAP